MTEDSVNPASRGSRRVIAAGFGLMLLLLLAITAVAVTNMSAMEAHLEQVVEVRNVKAELVTDLRYIGRERSLTLYHMALVEDPFERDELASEMSRLASLFIATRSRLDQMEMTDAERAAIAGVYRHVNLNADLQRQVMELMQADQLDAANTLLINESIPAQNEMMDLWENLLDDERRLSALASQEARRSYQSSVLIMLLIGFVLVIIGAGVSVFVTRKTLEAEGALREVNIDLEARVRERTSELTAANQSLEQTISTLKETREYLVQSEKMASLGALVAGVAHEINTPIGISMTAASHLQQESQDLFESFRNQSMKRSTLEAFLANTNEACDILAKNLKRAADLIGSFKRVAVDQASDTLQRFELRSYIDEVITSLAPSFKRRSVVVKNRCRSDLLIEANPGAIYQVLSNLIQNSLIHGFEPDQPGAIEINAREFGEDIEIVYRDNGKGIAGSDLGHVFDPFFTTRRGQGGSGLGLHIVYNRVTSALGGRIHVESDLGRGVLFRINIPRNGPKAQDGALAARSASIG